MGHRSALCRAGFFLLLPLFIAAAHAQGSAVLGPVEQVNRLESSLTVLGQTFGLTPSVVITIGTKRYPLSVALRVIQPGAYVSVVGEMTSGRPTAQVILVSSRPYVPGASDVYISGVVTSYDSSTGQAKVGHLQIDATPTFATDASTRIGVGSRIEAFGRQATAGGIVWANSLEVRRAIDVESISGTGASTAVQSISGTGMSKQSISGTGASTAVQSISGTGMSKQSISGTGASTAVHSISGTGAGMSMQSISGTGAQTAAQSISGTGVRVSTQSISGTGAQTAAQSISGTGARASTQSISGTGARTAVQSISGTGTRSSVRSISGTGTRTTIN